MAATESLDRRGEGLRERGWSSMCAGLALPHRNGPHRVYDVGDRDTLRTASRALVAPDAGPQCITRKQPLGRAQSHHADNLVWTVVHVLCYRAARCAFFALVALGYLRRVALLDLTHAVPARCVDRDRRFSRCHLVYHHESTSVMPRRLTPTGASASGSNRRLR